MTFSTALELLKQGKRLTRQGWNGKGMYVEVQYPDANSKMGLPYIFMRPVTGHLVPWVASHTDLLTDDWMEVA